MILLYQVVTIIDQNFLTNDLIWTIFDVPIGFDK